MPFLATYTNVTFFVLNKSLKIYTTEEFHQKIPTKERELLLNLVLYSGINQSTSLIATTLQLCMYCPDM